MTKFPQPGAARHFFACVLALAMFLAGGSNAVAQETQVEAPAVTVKEAPLPEVDPTYLDPLKALLEDENAFVDELWAMGNSQFERIDTLNHEISQSTDPIAVHALLKEKGECVARLEALTALGLQSFDHNARVHNFNGTVSYDVRGKELEGVKEWHTAVSLDSKYSDPYNNLGMHYFHAGNYPLGFQNMDRALDLEPKNPDYCFNMAQNYLIYRPQTEEHRGWDAKRVYKEAMKLSKKATKLAPEDFEILQDYAVNFLAAENFGEETDWKAAVKAWQAARKHAPEKLNLYFTWLNEGRAWRALENWEEAKRCFEAALQNIPDNVDKGLTQRLLNEVSDKP